jgi:hypothetical protein
MDSEFSDDRRQASPGVGPWVVELRIPGCTIRRRATRRRNLLGVVGGLLPSTSA